MSEDEAETERPIELTESVERATADDGTADDVTADDGTAEDVTAVDRAAESFVSLEAELRGLTGGDGLRYGVAENVARVPATAVPDDYPNRIASTDALKLRVVPEETRGVVQDVETAVYFAWPPDDDGPLSRLLALRGIDPDEFADLHGERIPLAVEDGYLVPRLPPGGRRGSPTGVYGVLLGLAGNLGALALLGLGLGSVVTSLPAFVVLALLNLVALPLGTYLDARHLLTTTDWDHGPPFWAALAILPGVNVLSSLAYLYTREAAEPV